MSSRVCGMCMGHEAVGITLMKLSAGSRPLACIFSPLFLGNKVTSEVRRVMGPSTPRLFPQIPRKPKRTKTSIAAEKYGNKRGRLSTATFQKKLVVFRFMPPSKSQVEQPKTFTRCDKYIVVRGLLPSISVESPESEVRDEILEVIRGATYEPVFGSDFEFINMGGKQASVPQCKDGFQWNGRAVKELAGNGCVYVRLLRDIDFERDCEKSSSEEDLPSVSVRRSTPYSGPSWRSLSISAAAQQSSTTTPSTSVSIRSTSSLSVGQSSTSTPTRRRLSSDSSCTEVSWSSGSSSTAACSSGPSSRNLTSQSPPSSSVTLSSDEGNPSKDLDKLSEVFRLISEKNLKYIYYLSKHSLTSAMDCLLDGPSFDSLRALAASQITVKSEDSPRIRLERDDDNDDWVEAAMVFYKQAKFNKDAGVHISIRGQPAVDTGGVRRQFFSVVFAKLASPSSLTSCFEGPPNRLRPIFKASVLSSGMLKTIGMMIAHSVLLDGQGFPFFADYCYYYIADCYDLAITCIEMEDIGIKVKTIMEEVSKSWLGRKNKKGKRPPAIKLHRSVC